MCSAGGGRGAAVQASGKYDFSQIYLIQQDIRKGFRNLSLQKQRFTKQLAKNHDKFFQNILQQKRQLYYGRLLDSNGGTFKQSAAVQANTIKQMQTRSASAATAATRQNLNLRQEDFSYKLPADAYPHAEEIDFIGCLREEMELERKHKQETMACMIEAKKELFEEEEIEEREIMLLEQEAQRRQALIDRLFQEDMNNLGYQEFNNLMKDDQLLVEMSKKILDEIYTSQSNFKVADMKDLLRMIDKNLFQELKNGNVSLDQLKTRILEKIQSKDPHDYFCLDDIKQMLGADYLNYNEKEIDQYIKMVYNKDIKKMLALENKQELQNWQINEHCLRSIYNLGVNVNKKKRVNPQQRMQQKILLGLGTSNNKQKSPQTADTVGHQRGRSLGKAKMGSSILFGMATVKKNDPKMFTEKLKETLQMHQRIQDRKGGDGVMRNYGNGWTMKQMEQNIFENQYIDNVINLNHQSTEIIEMPPLDNTIKQYSFLEGNKRQMQAKKSHNKKVQETKCNYGFLRRLEESGNQVQMTQEVNDILYLEEKEADMKDRMVEEFQLKQKKPRPRDIFDVKSILQEKQENAINDNETYNHYNSLDIDTALQSNNHDINNNIVGPHQHTETSEQFPDNVMTSTYNKDQMSNTQESWANKRINNFVLSSKEGNQFKKANNKFNVTTSQVKERGWKLDKSETTSTAVGEDWTSYISIGKLNSRNLSSQKPRPLTQHTRRTSQSTFANLSFMQDQKKSNSRVSTSSGNNRRHLQDRFSSTQQQVIEKIEEEYDTTIKHETNNKPPIVSQSFWNFLADTGIPVVSKQSQNQSMISNNNMHPYDSYSQDYQTNAMLYRLKQQNNESRHERVRSQHSQNSIQGPTRNNVNVVNLFCDTKGFRLVPARKDDETQRCLDNSFDQSNFTKLKQNNNVGLETDLAVLNGTSVTKSKNMVIPIQTFSPTEIPTTPEKSNPGRLKARLRASYNQNESGSLLMSRENIQSQLIMDQIGGEETETIKNDE